MTSKALAIVNGAAQSYAHIESLQQIRPPYPAQGSADWWALRRRVEELIAAESRKRKTTFTEAEFIRSDLARKTSLGSEDAQRAYERNGFTREQWMAKWNPSGKHGSRDIPTDFR